MYKHKLANFVLSVDDIIKVDILIVCHMSDFANRATINDMVINANMHDVREFKEVIQCVFNASIIVNEALNRIIKNVN